VSNKLRLSVFTKDEITPYQFDKGIAITWALWGILISSASSGPVHRL